MEKHPAGAAQPNLGTEPVGRLLFKLALPAITAQVINLLYNMVDRMYIGHIPDTGPAALTGMGVAMPVIMMFSAFAALVSMGGAPRASIFMGKGDKPMAERILGNCTAAMLLLSAVLTVAFQIWGKPVLWLFGASEATIGYAWSYMRIYSMGTVFVLLALGLNAFINAQGFARMGMFTVLIGAVCNIVLDPIFIFVFDMGVAGAAWATIISQGISCIWVVAFLCGKKTYLRIRLSNLRIAPSVLLPCIGLGVSPFIMQMTESAISVCFNTSMRTYGGDDAVAAMTVLISVMQFSMLPLTGLSQGCQPIVSYNYGAGNEARVAKAFRLLLTCALTYSISLWALCLVRPGVLVAIFLDQPELSAYAQRCLRVFMSGSLFFGAQLACQQTFVALSRAKISVFLALLRKVILLIPLIYILPAALPVNKVLAVILAEPVADLTAVTVTTTTFAIAFRRIRAEMRRRAGQVK